ncbi:MULTISPECIES: MocR-like pyridoxine biosynthesis transcription factor PdxR [Clostridium]|uniref:MocR-like pyridoxine biosynthesis transcription factor PdxR n=1 Tax=Clostridium TaxID=1485 RepID=UPI0007733801|nr:MULTISPECIES: PLP-dependent aminotransferase family protein [Clostridium]AUM94538.1 GntR family transcriptional regulator [Clostridium sporogenes]AVQ51971.1 PLP-dependent aminotransferase family protein [Clostridium botulinum]
MLYIDRGSNIPIYQQIYEQMKRDIISGNLPVESRVISTRVLASELHVGRNSVENAYDQLRLEGYITSIPGSGYIVNKLEFDLIQESPKEQRQSKLLTEHLAVLPDKIKYSFQYGELDETNFPKKLWRTYVANVLDEPLAHSMHSYEDGKGDPQLRQQIKQYLYHSRGVQCETEQIILCSGTQSALETIIRIFSGKKTVAMEEPCYDGARAVFQSNGFKILPVPVREDGIDLEKLSSQSIPIVYLSPSHQFPTGAVMPIHNRMKVLNLARQRDMMIIEDDYDSEFRYKGRPIPSLQSIDQAGRVIYVGTFSKALSPGLRISYLVLPTWILAAYQEKYRGYQCTIPLIEQKVLLHFMQDGHWEKHIRKVCLSQKRKHDTLIAAIHQIIGDRVRVYGHHAGLHILLEFVDGQQEDTLVQKAMRYGVQVRPVSPFWLGKGRYSGNAVVLGYGKIKEKDIVPAVELLNKAWFEE